MPEATASRRDAGAPAYASPDAGLTDAAARAEPADAPPKPADLPVSPVTETAPAPTRPAATPSKRPARPAAPSADAIPTPERAAIDAAFLARRELRRGLSDNLRALRTESADVADRVSVAFRDWNPSALTGDEVARRNFVPHDADLADTQTRVIERRIGVLEAASPGLGLRVRTSGGAGKLVEGLSGGNGKIKIGPLVRHVADRQDALMAPPPAPAAATSVAAATADEVVADIESPSSGAKDKKDNGTAAAALGVDEFVDLAVRRQMDSATAPEFRPRFDVIPTGERKDETQAQILETFSLRPGASDVESVHDFNVLRIAFEHVWTRIFNGEIESLGRELYKEYVDLKDFLGYDAPDTPITTIDDLRRLMAEIKELSQIAQAEVPVTLGGGTGRTETPRSSDDLEDAARDFGAVATGGLSLLVEWAIREFGRAGQKPVLTWNEVDGDVLNRGDRITATIQDGVAPAGSIELVLLTDGNSHKKEFAFQTYVEQTGRFQNVVFVTNFEQGVQIVDGGQHLRSPIKSIQSSDVPIGMIEFASEETPTLALGRYVLGGLGDRLKDRSRVTFYWKDN